MHAGLFGLSQDSRPAINYLSSWKSETPDNANRIFGGIGDGDELKTCATVARVYVAASFPL